MRRRWLMVFLAHNLLKLSSSKGGPVAWIKAGLATVGSRCRYAAVEGLRSLIDLVMRLAQRVGTADELLRYTLSDMKGLKTLHQVGIA